jgi:DNA-directed RNA polymerase specialized sigma24 family protein
MQTVSSLSELRSDYVGGRIERKTLEGLIFQYLLNSFDRYNLFRGEREKWGDFVGWLYPRLSRAIDYYKENGASFDTYISTIVQWSSKEYKIREAEHRTTEYACWLARAEEMQTCCLEPEYVPEVLPGDMLGEKAEPVYPEYEKTFGEYTSSEKSTERIKACIAQTKITPRQILLLVLKSYYFITDDFLCRIAEITGIKKNELRDMIDKLHAMREKREATIRELQDRIHSQYYRCLAFQKRLAAACAGTAKYAKLTNYVNKAWKRFFAMRKRLSGIRVDATNKQIALLLNIPKGTVDSALHNAREKWNSKIGSRE